MSKTDIQRFEDNFDTIVKYYFDERHQDKLSEVLQAKLDRWKFVRMVYSSWKVTIKREVATALVKQFNIDEATAYRDIADAQRLYVRLEEVNREFERIIRIEEIKSLRAKAIAKGDLKTAAECDKNLIKIGGYDKELAPPAIIKNIVNQFVYDPRLVDGEKIEGLEQILASYIPKKRKQILDADDAEVLEEELKGGNR